MMPHHLWAGATQQSPFPLSSLSVPTHNLLQVPGSMAPVEHSFKPTPGNRIQRRRLATCSLTLLPACSLTASPEFQQWLQAQRSPGSSWWARLASVLLLALVLCAGCLLMPQPDQLSTPETATAIVEQPSNTKPPQSAPSEGPTVAHGSQAVSTLVPEAIEVPEPQQLLSEPLDKVRGSTEGLQPAQPQRQESLSTADEYAGQQQQPQAELEAGRICHGEPELTVEDEETEQQQDQSQSALEDSGAWNLELSVAADEGHAVLSNIAPAEAGQQQQQQPQAEPGDSRVWDGKSSVAADEEYTEQQQAQSQSDLDDSCVWMPELSAAADESLVVLSEAAPAVAGQRCESRTETVEEEVPTGQALRQIS